jgi:hypothetical protein
MASQDSVDYWESWNDQGLTVDRLRELQLWSTFCNFDGGGPTGKVCNADNVRATVSSILQWGVISIELRVIHVKGGWGMCLEMVHRGA